MLAGWEMGLLDQANKSRPLGDAVSHKGRMSLGASLESGGSRNPNQERGAARGGSLGFDLRRTREVSVRNKSKNNSVNIHIWADAVHPNTLEC